MNPKKHPSAIIILIFAILLTSCAPKISNPGRVQYKPTKSEIRQRNFIILWTVAGAIIIAVAIQDDLKK